MMHAETESPQQSSQDSQLQYLKYKDRVTIIGWVGEIISIVVLVLSACFLHFRNELLHILHILFIDTKDDGETDIMQSISNVVVAVCATSYVLSLINILVCSMLLIGIARGCAALLLPWLLYHSFIFGITLYLAVYTIIYEIILPVHCFILTALMAILSLGMFMKIISDVLTYFKCMYYIEEKHETPYELEQNERCGSNQSTPYNELDINSYRCTI